MGLRIWPVISRDRAGRRISGGGRPLVDGSAIHLIHPVVALVIWFVAHFSLKDMLRNVKLFAVRRQGFQMFFLSNW